MKISTFFVNAILFFTSQLLKLNYSVTEKAISLPLTEKLLSLYYIDKPIRMITSFQDLQCVPFTVQRRPKCLLFHEQKPKLLW